MPSFLPATIKISSRSTASQRMPRIHSYIVCWQRSPHPPRDFIILFLWKLVNKDNGADRSNLQSKSEITASFFSAFSTHGTSPDQVGKDAYTPDYLCRCNPVSAFTRSSSGCSCPVLQALGSQSTSSVARGVSFELTTYGLAIASLSPFELPRHSIFPASFTIMGT